MSSFLSRNPVLSSGVAENMKIQDAEIGNLSVTNLDANITINVLGNVTATYGNIGNTRFLGGNVAVSGQINVLGNVVSSYLIGDHAGNVTAPYGNIGNTRFLGGNVAVSGQINVLGNVVSSYLIGDHAGNVTAPYGNIGNTRFLGGNVAVSGQINVIGNVVATYFIGNGSQLTGVTAPATLPTVASLDVRGNVIGSYANVTSVIALSGNVGNVTTSGGNVTATYFIGNGSQLTGVTSTLPTVANLDVRGNVSGSYANVSRLVVNIISDGNVVIAGGNISASGQINAIGNVVANYFIGNVIGSYANVSRLVVNTISDGNVVIAGGNISASGQINAIGNVVANYFIGSEGNISNLIVSNLYASDIILSSNHITLGYLSGYTKQNSNSIAIGAESAYNKQGNSAIAIGPAAGYNTQADLAIAIGLSAGSNKQGNGAIAIGALAGTNQMGSNSICIGTVTECGGDGSIVFNATGSAINVNTGNIFVVKPVRADGTNSKPYMTYDTSTGEIAYNSTGNVSAGYFFGNGSQLTGVLPGIANLDTRGNVIGSYANVTNIIATVGNVGNTRFAGGNVSVSGQVNISGNVVAPFFVGNGSQLFGLSASSLSNTGVLQGVYYVAMNGNDATADGSELKPYLTVQAAHDAALTQYPPVSGTITKQVEIRVCPGVFNGSVNISRINTIIRGAGSLYARGQMTTVGQITVNCANSAFVYNNTVSLNGLFISAGLTNTGNGAYILNVDSCYVYTSPTSSNASVVNLENDQSFVNINNSYLNATSVINGPTCVRLTGNVSQFFDTTIQSSGVLSGQQFIEVGGNCAAIFERCYINPVTAPLGTIRVTSATTLANSFKINITNSFLQNGTFDGIIFGNTNATASILRVQTAIASGRNIFTGNGIVYYNNITIFPTTSNLKAANTTVIPYATF
jgi:hypothetical protein